jgi:hypothetical protein
MSGRLHAPVAVIPKKDSRYFFDMKMGGTQNRSGRSGKEKNSALAGNRTPVFNM